MRLLLVCSMLALVPVASSAQTPAKAPWWSLQPLSRPSVFAAQAPARNPIDAFILAKLREQGLTPAPEADRHSLVRRLYFDLLGLPPTPVEVSAFVNDAAPDAYEKLVDRLLASPHYGERWARHWMDLVHFAETHGHDQDRVRPNAWPYRDYLIEAFNSDRPYHQFVAEQIAADVLSQNDPTRIRALGFLATGPWDESSLRDIREDSIDREIGHYLDRDDMVTTALCTFMSVTVHCARCHDHKFDPISQDDYYALQAVFAGVGRADRPFQADPVLQARHQDLRRQLTALERSDAKAAAAIAESLGVSTSVHPHCLREKIVRDLAALPAPQMVYAVGNDFAPDGSHKPPLKPRTVHVLKRGDIRKPGNQAEPGALACIRELPARFSPSESEHDATRREALAKWLIDARNPLTWRAIVNRIWKEHFGRGLVDTPNDFGRMGSLPSHPELLDWLAAEFRDSGQSLKALHRLIVTSATYRQDSSHHAANARIDGNNRYLWRMQRSRLDAESVRDAILLVSNRLDRRAGGPSDQQFALKPGIHVTPIVTYTTFQWDRPTGHRRSVYRFIFRTLPDPFVDCLDGADASQLTAVRNTSITALQALSLLNNDFVLAHSQAFAATLEAATPDRDAQLALACERTWSRPPTIEELVEMRRYANQHGLANLCRLLFNSNEFLFVN